MTLIYSTKSLQVNDLISYPEIHINENETTFLIGPSGSGKTTYLKLLNRTINTEQGHIYYNDSPIEEFDVLTYRKNVLLVPQEVFLLDDSIRQNYKFFYTARNQNCPDDSTISKYLDLCCVDFSPSDNCTHMSGGERQRVFMSIYVSLATKVLLLDEPTSALDNFTSQELMRNVKTYCNNKKITLVCVSHNEELIDLFADKIITLGD